MSTRPCTTPELPMAWAAGSQKVSCHTHMPASYSSCWLGAAAEALERSRGASSCTEPDTLWNRTRTERSRSSLLRQWMAAGTLCVGLKGRLHSTAHNEPASSAGVQGGCVSVAMEEPCKPGQCRRGRRVLQPGVALKCWHVILYKSAAALNCTVPQSLQPVQQSAIAL